MKNGSRITSLLGQVCVAIGMVALATGCFQLPPIEVTVPLDINMDLGNFQGPLEFTLDIGGGHTFGDFGDAAGLPFEDLESPPLELAGFPSEQEIVDMAVDSAEGFVLTDFAVSELELVGVFMDATENDFDTITDVAGYFVPKPVDSIEQGLVLMGSASGGSFGAQIELAPPQDLDILSLIRENDANPAAGGPAYVTVVSGTVPEDAPTWDTSANVRVWGEMGLSTPQFPVCDLPTTADVTEMIRDMAGDLVARLVTVTKLELLQVMFTATQNDFEDINEIHLFYVPKPVDGVEQAPVELGQAVSGVGLGAEVILTPSGDEPVDFLELVTANDANPAEGCPHVYMTVGGDIPEAIPSWYTEITLNVYIRIGC